MQQNQRKEQIHRTQAYCTKKICFLKLLDSLDCFLSDPLTCPSLGHCRASSLPLLTVFPFISVTSRYDCRLAEHIHRLQLFSVKMPDSNKAVAAMPGYQWW